MKRNMFWKALRLIVALKIGRQNTPSSFQAHLIDSFLPLVAPNKIRIPMKAFSDTLFNFIQGDRVVLPSFLEQSIITLMTVSPGITH